MNLVADPTSNELVTGMLEAAKRLDDHAIRKKEPITVEILTRLFYNLMGTPQSLGNVRDKHILLQYYIPVCKISLFPTNGFFALFWGWD